MVEALPLLFCMRCSSFPDGFARLELSALAERFNVQIRVEKRHVAVVPSALKK